MLKRNPSREHRTDFVLYDLTSLDALNFYAANKLAGHAIKQVFSGGHTLYNEGHPARCAYFIEKGRVALTHRNGKREIVGPGGCVGLETFDPFEEWEDSDQPPGSSVNHGRHAPCKAVTMDGAQAHLYVVRLVSAQNVMRKIPGLRNTFDAVIDAQEEALGIGEDDDDALVADDREESEDEEEKYGDQKSRQVEAAEEEAAAGDEENNSSLANVLEAAEDEDEEFEDSEAHEAFVRGKLDDTTGKADMIISREIADLKNEQAVKSYQSKRDSKKQMHKKAHVDTAGLEAEELQIESPNGTYYQKNIKTGIQSFGSNLGALTTLVEAIGEEEEEEEEQEEGEKEEGGWWTMEQKAAREAGDEDAWFAGEVDDHWNHEEEEEEEEVEEEELEGQETEEKEEGVEEEEEEGEEEEEEETRGAYKVSLLPPVKNVKSGDRQGRDEKTAYKEQKLLSDLKSLARMTTEAQEAALRAKREAEREKLMQQRAPTTAAVAQGLVASEGKRCRDFGLWAKMGFVEKPNGSRGDLDRPATTGGGRDLSSRYQVPVIDSASIHSGPEADLLFPPQPPTGIRGPSAPRALRARQLVLNLTGKSIEEEEVRKYGRPRPKTTRAIGGKRMQEADPRSGYTPRGGPGGRGIAPPLNVSWQ